LQPRAEANRTRLELHIDEQLAPRQQGAEQYLRQVLSNLLANAIRFTEDGWVRVEVQVLDSTAGGQRLRCCVRDNGIGIAASMREKIFERFVQASDEVSRRYGGTGLGLAICKHMLQQLDGRIGVDSELGQGSCFWFELVLGVGQEPLPSPQLQVPAQGLKILVVEDVALNREVASGLLERDGHQVWLAQDGEAALALCRQQAFDLLLLDVHLPGISGVELCRDIRRRPGPNRQVRIFALTASVQPSVVRSYLQAGMQGILGKPLQLASLRQALAGQLQPPPLQAPQGLLDQGLLDTHRSLLGEQKLQDLLQILADALDQQQPLLADALAAEDCTEVLHLAHRLAGSADSLGFCALARVLRELEEAAQQADRPALASLAARLQQPWQESRALLQRLLAA